MQPETNFLLTKPAIGFRFFGFIAITMANYSFALWITLSGGLLLLFAYAAFINLRRRHLPQIDLDEVVPFLLPVNLDALVDAIDPSQDAYLRHSHSPADFQKLQRKRMRLAAEYLHRMSHNAALLQRVGYGQIHSSNRVVAEQGQELIDAGVNVRLYAFLGLAALFFRRVWVFRSMSLAKVSQVQKMMCSNLIPAYNALRSKAEDLTMLRDRAFHDALLQSL